MGLTFILRIRSTISFNSFTVTVSKMMSLTIGDGDSPDFNVKYVVPWVEFNTIDFVRGIQLSSGGISERVIRFLPTLAPPDSPTAESKPPTADAMRQFELNVAKLAADSEINCLMCPITKVYMTDPAIAADGHTYQRDAIIEWFTLSRRSPMTNQLRAHKPRH